MRYLLVLFGLLLTSTCFLTNCSSSKSPALGLVGPAKPAPVFAKQTEGLDNYWYQGKAEISTYELAQNRYDGLHPGEAVLIFVSEDFLPKLQVKNDRGPRDEATLVLKTNQIRRFTTGIYDYSIMTSVFTPTQTAQYPFTLKVSMASQDWCGQTYNQLNFRNGQYRSELHSYFESEADEVAELTPVLLEDELFNRLRMGPDAIPTGNHLMLPALSFLRLRHFPTAAVPVDISFEEYTESNPAFNGEALRTLRVEFPTFDRSLRIVFRNEPPYQIEGWLDTYPSAFDGVARTTVAARKSTILDPYWTHNGTQDIQRRSEIGLQGR